MFSFKFVWYEVVLLWASWNVLWNRRLLSRMWYIKKAMVKYSAWEWANLHIHTIVFKFRERDFSDLSVTHVSFKLRSEKPCVIYYLFIKLGQGKRLLNRCLLFDMVRWSGNASAICLSCKRSLCQSLINTRPPQEIGQIWDEINKHLKPNEDFRNWLGQKRVVAKNYKKKMMDEEKESLRIR